MRAKIAAIFISLFACAFGEEITVLGINDMHAEIDAFPKLATFLREEREKKPQVLLLSAGDNRTGNPYVDNGEQPGIPVIKLMNKLKFDASALGNHEFDSGITGLKNMLSAADFPFLCANIKTENGVELRLAPYHIFERSGVRIGIIGLVQIGKNGIPDVQPDKAEGFLFYSPQHIVRNYAYLREQCDILIILSHLGFEGDCLLAENFPEADAIIGGHTHTKTVHTSPVNGVLITQAENKVKYITRLTFEVENGKVLNKKAEHIPLRSLAEDSDMLAAVEKIKNAPYLKRQIATIVSPIDGKDKLGCLMADALRTQTKADIAVINRGNVRINTLPQGAFTVADSYRLDPYCNQIVVFKASGKELIDFLNAIPATDHHGAPCVSGMKYTATIPSQQLKPMHITEATLSNGLNISPDSVYTIATNVYLMSTVTACPADKGTVLDINVPQAIMLYLEGLKDVHTSDERRIKLIQKDF